MTYKTNDKNYITGKEAVFKLYENWKEDNEYFKEDNYTESEIKKIFLSDAICNITTYDDDLSLEFGNMIYDTMEVIFERKTFEYIKHDENYIKYILSCHFIEDWLDWGTSIRGAWFNYFDAKFEPKGAYLCNIIVQDYIDIDECFMNWFMLFLKE